MRTSRRPFATRVCWLSVQASWNLIRRNYLTPCNALWQLTVLTLQRIRSVCLNGFGNRTSPSDNSNNRWKRLCLLSWAASPCVWTLRALTRNLLTYLLTYYYYYYYYYHYYAVAAVILGEEAEVMMMLRALETSDRQQHIMWRDQTHEPVFTDILGYISAGSDVKSVPIDLLTDEAGNLNKRWADHNDSKYSSKIWIRSALFFAFFCIFEIIFSNYHFYSHQLVFLLILKTFQKDV